MNTFKLKMKRQQKRHDKQQWTKKVKEEIEEGNTDLQTTTFKSNQTIF